MEKEAKHPTTFRMRRSVMDKLNDLKEFGRFTTDVKTVEAIIERQHQVMSFMKKIRENSEASLIKLENEILTNLMS